MILGEIRNPVIALALTTKNIWSAPAKEIKIIISANGEKRRIRFNCCRNENSNNILSI
jgi:hypothetical protein